MKTMLPPSYHQNGFVVTHPLVYIMYSYVHHKATLLKKV